MLCVPVPDRLKPFVRSLRVYDEVESEQAVFRRLPHAESELLVRFETEIMQASVLGARTRVFEKPASMRAQTLLVRFRAGGAYPFFGLPMSELADQMLPSVELAQLAGFDEPAAVGGGVAVAEVVTRRLTQALERALPHEPASAAVVRRALRVLSSAQRLPSVAQLALQLGVSERTLRRGFDHIVGTSPKQYLRVLRWRRLLAAARRSAARDWAALADHAGYFDQAHLIAEFRALTGTTPNAFFSAQLPYDTALR